MEVEESETYSRRASGGISHSRFHISMGLLLVSRKGRCPFAILFAFWVMDRVSPWSLSFGNFCGHYLRYEFLKCLLFQFLLVALSRFAFRSRLLISQSRIP